MRWIGLYLAAFLLLGFVAAAESAAADPAKHAPADGHKHADPADHHEEHGDPTPAEEVSDQTHYHLFKGFHIPLGWWEIAGYKVPTRFMVTELLVAIVVALLFIGLANRVKDGNPVRGRLWNALEAVVLFIRDDVVRPNLDSKHHDHDEHGAHHGDAHHGHHHPATPRHDGDRYLPYIWTAFLFILGCNLFGLVPFLGSPTANIFVTGALALCSFILLHGSAISKMGVKDYFGSMWLNIDIPPMFGAGTVLSYIIKIMIFFLEFFGTFIKAFVLAVRLFANMFAGHMVVASILSFILLAKETSHLLWATVTLASVMGVVALSLLELFVAFLQAYIFVFLTALFTGMATNPEH